jgi:hypothetical protein
MKPAAKVPRIEVAVDLDLAAGGHESVIVVVMQQL